MTSCREQNYPLIFAGPSLYESEHLNNPELTFRGPAKCGDVLSAFKQGFNRIALIDGVFENQRSVWHKELLYVLSQGASVFGAASMGALRAAECAQFGMVGVGKIYQDYTSGRRTSDADVAIVHAPKELGYQPLSIAWCDVETTISAMCKVGKLDLVSADEILRSAKNIFFKTRTVSAIFDQLPVHSSSRARQEDFTKHFVSQKKLDAEKLIGHLSRRTKSCDFCFSDTHFFRKLFIEKVGETP